MTKDMLVGIASDTHGSIDARIAQRLRQCDIVLHAGDIMSADVLDVIRPDSGELYAVQGNNDISRLWDEKDWPILVGIPESLNLELPGGKLGMIHGHQIWNEPDRHLALRKIFPDAKALVYGHSHLRTYCDEESPWLLNPGAAGEVRNHGGPSCMILHASKDQWVLDFLRFSSDSSVDQPVVKTWRLESSLVT